MTKRYHEKTTRSSGILEIWESKPCPFTVFSKQPKSTGTTTCNWDTLCHDQPAGTSNHKIKHDRKNEKKNTYDLDHFAFQPLKVISMISTATFGDFSLSHGSAWEGSRGTRGTEAARFVGHDQILSVSTGCASFSYELLNIRDFKIYVKIYI